MSGTGRCVGLCWGTVSWCTTTTTVRRSWREPSTYGLRSKEIIQFNLKTNDILFVSDPECVSVFVRREIVDNHEKENALNIVTDERTYQVFAESPEDARCRRLKQQQHLGCVTVYVRPLMCPNTSVCLCSGWFNVLSKVRVCTPEQLLEMSHEQANPKNAVVSLFFYEFDLVCPIFGLIRQVASS